MELNEGTSWSGKLWKLKWVIFSDCSWHSNLTSIWREDHVCSIFSNIISSHWVLTENREKLASKARSQREGALQNEGRFQDVHFLIRPGKANLSSPWRRVTQHLMGDKSWAEMSLWENPSLVLHLYNNGHEGCEFKYRASKSEKMKKTN